MHAHLNFAEAFLVTDGAGRHLGIGEELRKGDLRLIDQGTVHGFEGDLEFVNVAFPASDPWGSAVRSLSGAERFGPIFARALADAARPSPARLMRFLGCLLAEIEETPPPVPGWLARAMAGPVALSVGERREVAGVEAATLSRGFRRYLGTTPSGWLAERRLERVAELLVATDRPIASIAEEVGWPDPSALHRRFRARFGVTPAVYRRSSGRVV